LPKTYILKRTQWVPQPLHVVFDFFSRPANLQSITPPFLDFKITDAPAEICAGSLIRYTLRLHGIPVRWKTEIADWKPPHSFVDLQISGPYTLWRHTHTFVEERGGTAIEDEVAYALPLGPVGRIAHWMLVRRDLKVIFDYRSDKMRELFGG
jgi:ligand-binding SRPBCC domain-containing protein